MREKLKTLPVSELRAIAAENKIPQIYTLRKAELVEKLAALYEARQKEASANTDAARTLPPEPAEEKVLPDAIPAESGPEAKNPDYEPKAEKDDSVPETEAEKPQEQERERGGLIRRQNYPRDNAERRPLRRSEYNPSPRPQQDTQEVQADNNLPPKSLQELDSGEKASGILEIMPDGYGFLRSNGYLPGEEDVYVAPSQIKKFNIKTGDLVAGSKRIRGVNEKFSALLYIESINGLSVSRHMKLTAFEKLTPVFPHERLHLETPGGELSMRIVDLLSPIGKGQRGMIVAQPKVGKTTLLKQIAKALQKNHPELHIIILLIDERPEEVTDMQETVTGESVEIVYSTFDEQPEHHKRVSEMVIERAKRLVEMKKDVIILLDSITRLTRAYNLTVTPSGRTLSGGLDPAALYMPKRFFGAARCMREGGSLTILATALLDTGSRLDDVVYEEFKGTGNMELVLNRKLSERRIFPAIDILKSSTRRDDLLLTEAEQNAVSIIRKVTSTARAEEVTEQIFDLFASTRTNAEFIAKLQYVRFAY